MKTTIKDYYGNPLKNGIYFIADKSEGYLCKILLNEDGRNFSLRYTNFTNTNIGSIYHPKEFAKKLIPFKGIKKNLEWAILSLEKEI